MAAEVDRYLGVPPGQGFVVDTYLLHQVEVGRVMVRTGRDGPLGLLRVTVEQLEDVDGTIDSTGPLVRIDEPSGWTEDYSPGEVLRLAGLLRAARDLVAT